MSIGLRQGQVRLVQPSSDWARRYLREKRRLARYLPKRGVVIEHIGSTAIPGLAAKPIIDIAVKIPSLKRIASMVTALERAGYTYKGEYGLPGRHFFARGTPVTQHLHVVQSGSEHWMRWIVFRDYLRDHPLETEAYNNLKRDLARRFAHNRDAYTKAKTPYIQGVLRRAMKKHKIPANQR